MAKPQAGPRAPRPLTPTRVFLCVAALAGALALPRATALPEYRLQALKVLHLAPDVGNQVTVDCTYCHVNKTGGAPWNPFGLRVQAKLSGNFPKDLYDVLAQNADSDGDGYEDVLEVFAGSRPGDKAVRPLVERAFLKKSFEAAGGLGLYKP